MRKKIPDDQKIVMDNQLRDEFNRAFADLHFIPIRDLCLKYNARSHYGMFMTHPRNRKKPAERLISVEQVIEEKALAEPRTWWPAMVTFVRTLCAK